jgi:hypothetical protein
MHVDGSETTVTAQRQDDRGTGKSEREEDLRLLLLYFHCGPTHLGVHV